MCTHTHTCVCVFTDLSPDTASMQAITRVSTTVFIAVLKNGRRIETAELCRAARLLLGLKIQELCFQSDQILIFFRSLSVLPVFHRTASDAFLNTSPLTNLLRPPGLLPGH